MLSVAKHVYSFDLDMATNGRQGEENKRGTSRLEKVPLEKLTRLAHGTERRDKGKVASEHRCHEIKREADIVRHVRKQSPLLDVAVHV